MSLRLHMCLEHEDEHIFHKNFYVAVSSADAEFIAGEGVKLLCKIMAAEVKHFFEHLKQ